MTNSKSLLTFIFCCLTLFVLITVYNPKWKKQGNKATISYDVSGYYQYLPAAFIYHDLKNFSFEERLHEKDINIETVSGQRLDNNHYLFQYPPGLAIMYTPFFTIAHFYASISPYDAHGYSFPYQAAIHFGSLFVAFLGLFYLRKFLLYYFSDGITALTVLITAIGTNYLIYASSGAAQVHSYLFTLNVFILIYTTKCFDKNRTQKAKDTIILAALLGLAVITRNTEILTIIFIFFYGISNPTRIKEYASRFVEIINMRGFYWALITFFLILSIQFTYTYHASGSFFTKSYGDQGFSFLDPHIYNCLFSARAGWLIYSPAVLLMLIGFIPLFNKHRQWFIAIFPYFIIFTYIHFSWDIWWYGGSVGQRTMIQTYPLLSIPLAVLLTQVYNHKSILLKTVISLFISWSLVHSIWVMHASLKGNILNAPQTTKAYLAKVYGTWSANKSYKRLLDFDEMYEGPDPVLQEIYTNPDTLLISKTSPKGTIQKIDVPFKNDGEWIRLSFFSQSPSKEWTVWKQPRVMLEFFNNVEKIKSGMYRPHRQIGNNEAKQHHFDIRIPNDKPFDRLRIHIDNNNTTTPLSMWDIKISVFE